LHVIGARDLTGDCPIAKRLCRKSGLSHKEAHKAQMLCRFFFVLFVLLGGFIKNEHDF
jgi:hypothetical protein